MPRIRSVHPGLFTDEVFVSCSVAARLLIIGLWTEADDQGVFKWKPITIKMRLFPADNVDVAALLTELSDQGLVKNFELSGKSFGAIRNFRKFQRPKSPNATHPLPNEFRIYVGLTDIISETDGDEPPSIPPKGEIPPQMEEGGGREKEEGVKETDDDSAGASALFDKLVKAARADISKPAWYDFNVSAAVSRWQALGLADDEILRAVEAVAGRRRDPSPVGSPAYFDNAMQLAAGEKQRPALTPIDGGKPSSQPPPKFDINKILKEG